MGMVKCLQCGAVLKSMSRHDFVQCKCPNETFVDGGDDYLRAGGKDLTKISVFNSTDGTWRPAQGNALEATPEPVEEKPVYAIYKYEIARADESIEMPIGAKVLHIGVQDQKIMLWALVDTTAPLKEKRFFTVIMTGEKFNPGEAVYLGTVVGFKNWLVCHIFEMKK